MPRLFTGLEIPAEDRPDPFPACGAAFQAPAGSTPKIITLPCASSAISTASAAQRNRLVAGSLSIASRSRSRSRACRASAAKNLARWSPPVVPSRPLIELQAELERLMQRIGLDPEGRKFTPHVTLARLRDASNQDVADYLSVRGYFPTRVSRPRASCCSRREPPPAAAPMSSQDSYALSA